MVFSAFGCGIERPDTELCIVNAPGLVEKCYNLKEDYDDTGHLKLDATPLYRELHSVQDLNKHLCVDPEGTVNLKAFIKELREAYED